MATKGGSLLGKADATIVGASYREAMADVTPDYGAVYAGEAANVKKFQTEVKNYFDNLHADNNKLADELKEATTKAMGDLGTDYDMMELFNSHLTSMKDRMESLPKTKKGDFERAKIRAEMNQLLESSKGLDDTISKVGTMIKAGDFNENTTEYPALLAISRGEATKEIIDGNLVYTYKDDNGEKQTIDRQGIEDALGQSDLEMESSFNKQGASYFQQGKQGRKFNRNKSVNSYEEIFTTPAGLAANMNERQNGLDYTFVESLAGKDGSKSIFEALTNMGPTTVAQYDVTGDNKITEADFAHPDNGIALIESLTKPRSKNYNFQAAKRAAAEFYADNIDQVEFNDGKLSRPVKTPKNENKNKFGLNLQKNYFTIQTPGGASYINGQTISNNVETFKSVQDKGSGIFTGYDKVPHKLIKGKWFTYDDETEDFTKESNATSIFTALGWSNNPQIMEYLKPNNKVSDKNSVMKLGLGSGGGTLAKPPNVSKEKWSSLSELEQMNLKLEQMNSYLENGNK